MHILLVPRGSGENPYLDELAEALSRRGHSVHIGTGRPIETLEYIHSEGLPDVIHIHWLSSFLIGDSSLTTLIKSIITAIGLVLAKTAGVRIIWTAHNILEHDRRHPRIETAVKRIFIRYIIDRTIVHEEAAKKEIIQEIEPSASIENKLFQVPHGNYSDYYPRDISREQARKQLGFEDERIYLFFGLIRAYKGVERLAEVFQDLEGEENRLLIVGQPSSENLRTDINDLADDDERIETAFEFIPEDEIQIYMHAADVVVLPFYSITTSGSVVLAMSFGNPVIAPESGCIPDTLPTEGRIMYHPNTADELLEALTSAKNVDLEEMGKVNLETAKSLDWDSIAQQTEQIYKS